MWEAARSGYAYVRRFTLDILCTASPLHPVHWATMLYLVRRVKPEYTMVKPQRLRVLYELSQEIDRNNVPGDIVECGVYNGGTAAMMAYPGRAHKKSRDLWLFDSFEGLPPPTENDGAYEQKNYYEGWCKGEIKKVEEIFRRLALPMERVHIVKGWFQDTFPMARIEPIALLHIDADWYESVKLCLEKFYPHVAAGGYVELDDYGTWEGCRKAVDEYFAAHHIRVELKTRDQVGFYFQKPH